MTAYGNLNGHQIKADYTFFLKNAFMEEMHEKMGHSQHWSDLIVLQLHRLKQEE